MHSTPPEPLQLHRLISIESVELSLSGTLRAEVLRQLVNKLPAIKDSVDAQDKLLKALVEREQLHSTGIGDGVALPHARNALVGLVEHPALVFGRHNQGIAYGSIDGQAAKLFILLVAPNVTSHLQILARLSRVLRHSKVREELLIAPRPEKIIQILMEAEHRL